MQMVMQNHRLNAILAALARWFLSAVTAYQPGARGGAAQSRVPRAQSKVSQAATVINECMETRGIGQQLF